MNRQLAGYHRKSGDWRAKIKRFLDNGWPEQPPYDRYPFVIAHEKATAVQYWIIRFRG
jgi:hypothetical protein